MQPSTYTIYFTRETFMGTYTRRIALLLSTLLMSAFFSCSADKGTWWKPKVQGTFGSNIVDFQIKFRPSSVLAYNTYLLNTENNRFHDLRLDTQFIPAQSIIDFTIGHRYVPEGCTAGAIRSKFSLRNKNIWGDSGSIFPTAEATIKDVDSVGFAHRHAITRQVVWIREASFTFQPSELFDVPCCVPSSLTMGFFPFELGRGISLGAAYAADPDFIGYFSPSYIDQFAPGFLLTGDLVRQQLSYDLYFSPSVNHSGTFDNINAETMGNIIGRRTYPQRGFGKINLVFASRLVWKPETALGGSLRIEPYVLYDREKEQRIEFLGDASLEMGTFGLNFEACNGRMEYGFEIAGNFGRQYVHATDRNVIVKEVRDGVYMQVNSAVYATSEAPAPDTPGKKAVYTSANQAAISVSPQSVIYNGKNINSDLINAPERFTRAYANTLGGMMLVADGAYLVHESQNAAIRLAGAFGFASGDENPNKDYVTSGDSEVDGDFAGFISLREAYTGKRVMSAFLMSGSGRAPRLLSFPAPSVANAYPDSVSHFTNLIFCGSGLSAKGSFSKRPWSCNPNIMFFWQANQTKLFDRKTDTVSLTRPARSYLGTELNLFTDIIVLDDLKFFGITGIFWPGGHYKDVAGRPLNKAQQAYFDSFDDTGTTTAKFVPTLGSNMAFFVQAGFEYLF
jgi:hypothetical protein